MILYIDTTQADKVIFAIGNNRKVIKKTSQLSHQDSFLMIGKLDEFLKKNKIKNGQIRKIIANKGPGSFVGIRVGAAIVQALSFAWKVPLKFESKEKFEKHIK